MTENVHTTTALLLHRSSNPDAYLPSFSIDLTRHHHHVLRGLAPPAAKRQVTWTSGTSAHAAPVLEPGGCRLSRAKLELLAFNGIAKGVSLEVHVKLSARGGATLSSFPIPIGNKPFLEFLRARKMHSLFLSDFPGILTYSSMPRTIVQPSSQLKPNMRIVSIVNSLKILISSRYYQQRGIMAREHNHWRNKHVTSTSCCTVSKFLSQPKQNGLTRCDAHIFSLSETCALVLFADICLVWLR